MPSTIRRSTLDDSSSTIIVPTTKDRPVAITVSVREAGRALGVSRATIYRLIEDGDLPSYRIRNRTLLKVSDLESLVSRSRSQVVPVDHLKRSKRAR
jgi:excisionase family DNA binding protein